MGRKNDPHVQKRVIKQVASILKKPTSRKVIGLNPSMLMTNSKLGEMFDLPTIIFHRFQATYDSNDGFSTEKSRVVWCVPYTIVALENMFFGDILSAVKYRMSTSEEVVYPLGLTNYQIGQRSVKTLRDKYRYACLYDKTLRIYTLDFKKFDSTIPQWAKDLFFAQFGWHIDKTENQAITYDFLRIYVKYTPFAFNNEIHYKEKGISSGLLITNFFDSWWNMVIHNVVQIIKDVYPDKIDDIMSENFTFENLEIDVSRLNGKKTFNTPNCRVVGDDSILLCDKFTFILYQKVCKMLGMEVSVKHETKHPDDKIFFLGRFWNVRNRPFQSENYMALRIVYCKWYKKQDLPFSVKDLHLNRMLSICLPLVGGKEFLDKYLFDYEPYMRFKESKKGFTYMKDFIENTFRYTDYTKAFDIDTF
jgi:hypothetical protein